MRFVRCNVCHYGDPINYPHEQREAICRACPERKAHGVYHWCSCDETGLDRWDCPRSRNARFNSRLTLLSATCDRWDEPGAICIPEIPTVVYTCDKPNCVARHPRVTTIMDRLGFSDWRFHWGPSGEPYWRAIRDDYIALLRNNEPPFLILEDDIGIREFHPWIVPPPDAQLIYLGGGGSWRNSRLVAAAKERLPDHSIYRVKNIGFEDIDRFPEWVRVYGMFGTHAILYTDKRIMLEVADAIEADPVQTDVVIGKNQWRWLCVLYKTPMFYQADGHNDAGTWDYATPLPPITREQRRQVAHAARGR